MVMTRDDDFFEAVTTDDCSTSPSTTVDSFGFFSDEDEIAMEGLDLSAVSLTPLVKEELKNSIQARRLADGKAPVKVHFTHRGPEHLTEEEKKRRQQRRTRNKFAAQKCRFKKREQGDQLEKEAEKLETRQEELQAEVDQLKRERELLQEMLDVHEPFCKKRRADNENIVNFNNDHTYTVMAVDSSDNNNVDVEVNQWPFVDLD